MDTHFYVTPLGAYTITYESRWSSTGHYRWEYTVRFKSETLGRPVSIDEAVAIAHKHGTRLGVIVPDSIKGGWQVRR